VWTGGSEFLSLPPGPACDLLFGTASIAPRAESLGEGDTAGAESARFVIEFGGEVRSWQHVQPTTRTGLLTRHRIPIPASDRRRTLELRLEGAPTIAAFLNPVLAPSRAQQARDEPPDLLLFLADTFRADNLTAYGGEHGLTPALDALIEDSLLFERAWTTAIWTLPSQASMMTGLLPFQHTALRPGRRIPRAAVTLAEHLRAAGYRTGAITDAGLVSRRHAFDQGFEFFDELFRDEFVDTHAAALDFLDADDGRPTFLFVQTYRVHRPYRVSAETRAAHGARLGIEGEFNAVFDELEAAGWKSGAAPLPPELEDTVRRLEAQYRGGVIDFDRDFRAFMDALEQRSFFDAGRMLFTSDHGEAFAEHGALWHHIGVWETMARVPFFVHGAGIEPGRSALSASLVDVPRTLSALAGLDPDPTWDGASVLDLTTDRPAWTFQCPPELPGLMGIVDGPTKVHLEASTAALAPPRLAGTYDLTRDPGEQRPDLLPASTGIDFVTRREPLARDALTPRYESDAAPLGSDAEAMLKALGYLDGE
ncbi:MAG: sulfatase, partial [Planctomycetota bacterium]